MIRQPLVLEDDDSFVVLGNAVLLAYILEDRAWAALPKEAKDEGSWRRMLQNVSDGRELRDTLFLAGALLDWYDGQSSWRPDAPLESFPAIYRRWDATMNSSEPLATVRIKDLTFTPPNPAAPWLDKAIGLSGGFELRKPIARLGVCPAVQALRQAVLTHFRSVVRPSRVSAPHHALSTDDQLKTDAGVARNADESQPVGPAAKPSVELPKSFLATERAKRAAEILDALHAQHPGCRTPLAEVQSALKAKGFSLRLVEKVTGWCSPSWKPPGRPPAGQHRLPDGALQQALAELDI